MAALEVLTSLTIDALASRLHTLLLPDTVPSADTWKILADRSQQVASHLQLKATEVVQVAAASAQTDQQAALPNLLEGIQAQSHQPVATTAQQATGLQTTGRKKKRQLGEIRRLPVDITATLCSP